MRRDTVLLSFTLPRHVDGSVSHAFRATVFADDFMARLDAQKPGTEACKWGAQKIYWGIDLFSKKHAMSIGDGRGKFIFTKAFMPARMVFNRPNHLRATAFQIEMVQCGMSPTSRRVFLDTQTVCVTRGCNGSCVSMDHVCEMCNRDNKGTAGTSESSLSDNANWKHRQLMRELLERTACDSVPPCQRW